ncbi:Vacuolar protein sorting-associated protein 5 [Serendipita sp. 407]|nr:Vacuolar protein sorting-associated protein 5 [Serendipita sp. 407]
MYQDDLDDLLPRLPNRQPALPSFSSGAEDPFSNPFTSESDPWGNYGNQTGGFDEWNENAFAEVPSQVQPFEQADKDPSSPDVLRDPHKPAEYVASGNTIHKDSSVDPSILTDQPTTAHGTVEEHSIIADPLDATLSNLQEEPEHVPVFRRKLPLVTKDQDKATVESQPIDPTPTEATEAETRKEGLTEDIKTPVESSKIEEAIPPSKDTPTEEVAPKQIDPSTPATPSNMLDIATPTNPNPEPMPPSPRPPSVDTQVTPSHMLSRDPSTSDAEGRSFLDKVAISPLERTPSSLPNPLDRNFTVSSLSIGPEMGGWGDTWNPGSSNGNAYGYSETPVGAAKSTIATEGQIEAKEQDEEDPEDNIPLAHSLSKPPQSVQMYTITVGDPQKVGDPISAHIIYTVQTTTTNPTYKKQMFSVLRRYSDFVWLYDALCANNPGVIVPPIPEKNSLGRFQDAFVEARRLALNKCIQKMANHPGLCNDKDLQLFLESDNFALDIKHRKAEENTGLLSILSTSIASSKFYETDDWFDTKKAYLDSLEGQLKGLVRSMEAVAKQRAEQSQALSELADALEILSGADISKQLSNTFSQLAIVQKRARKLQDEQAQQDVVTFAGTVEEYGRMINSVRVAFASRIKCFGQWQNTENEFRRVKANHEKARKASKNPERLHYHIQEVADAERKAMHSKSEFERVTKLVKIEWQRFDMERVEDFKRSLEAFLEGMIGRQKELIGAWEEYQSLLLQRSGTNVSSNTATGDVDTSTISSAA